MTITEDHINRLMTRARQKFNVKTIEIRSPFDGKPTGSSVLYRDDTKEIFKVGVSADHIVTTNYEANQIFAKMSEITPMKLIGGSVHDGGRTVITTAKLGTDQTGKFKVGGGRDRGRGEWVEKRLTLINRHSDGGINHLKMLVTPVRYTLKYSGQVHIRPQASSPVHMSGNELRNILISNGTGYDYASIVECARQHYANIEEECDYLFNTKLTPENLEVILSLHANDPQTARAVCAQYMSCPKTYRDNLWNIYTSLVSVKQANLTEEELYSRTFSGIVGSTRVTGEGLPKKGLTIEEVFGIFTK